MKKRLQGIIIGVLVCAILLGVSVLAAGNSKMIEAFYTGIRLFVDGGEYIPTDANGKVVEPFIYNGTTYLPVRAVANAFGKDVIWDGANQTVYLGKKDQNQPDAYLDKLQYNDYRENKDASNFAIISGNVTDFDDNIYTSGLIFNTVWYEWAGGGPVSIDDIDAPNILISYPLNSQYNTLKGKIVLPKEYNLNTWGEKNNCGTSATDIWFYGDGELLYKATSVTASMPFSFDIDVEGVNQLTIKVKTENRDSYVALTNLALYK